MGTVTASHTNLLKCFATIVVAASLALVDVTACLHHFNKVETDKALNVGKDKR